MASAPLPKITQMRYRWRMNSLDVDKSKVRRLRVVMLVQKVDPTDWLVGFTVGWIKALAARVQSVDVIALERRAADLPANVRVHSLGKEHGNRRSQQLIAFERIIVDVSRHADVIFGHLTPRYTWLAAPFATLHRVPQCLWYTHRQIDIELRLALASSRWITTAAPNSFPLPSAKLHVMGHGIDTNRFSPDGTMPDASPPLVLAVGRLAPIKHHHVLIEAAAHLRDQGVNAQVAIAGDVASADGPAYRAQLEARIVALDLGEHIKLLGAVTGADLIALYRRAAVVTNLSPAGLFDKAALEAMLTARPVLVANPAFDDLLGAHVAALRVPAADDVLSVSARLADLLSLSAAKRSSMGEELRQQTARAHGLEGLMDRLTTLFASA